MIACDRLTVEVLIPAGRPPIALALGSEPEHTALYDSLVDDLIRCRILAAIRAEIEAVAERERLRRAA